MVTDSRSSKSESQKRLKSEDFPTSESPISTSLKALSRTSPIFRKERHRGGRKVIGCEISYFTVFEINSVYFQNYWCYIVMRSASKLSLFVEESLKKSDVSTALHIGIIGDTTITDLICDTFPSISGNAPGLHMIKSTVPFNSNTLPAMIWLGNLNDVSLNLNIIIYTLSLTSRPAFDRFSTLQSFSSVPGILAITNSEKWFEAQFNKEDVQVLCSKHGLKPVFLSSGASLQSQSDHDTNRQRLISTILDVCGSS
ncbi:hypothetical protein RCL1_001153 [Eukaryota sp. TZLM3-RCL]